MHHSVDELLDEYDELTSQVLSADYRYVAARLQQWFDLLETGDDGVTAHINYLEKKTSFEKIEAENLKRGKGIVGSGTITLPHTREDRLAFHLVLFRHLAQSEREIVNFSIGYFASGSSNFNVVTSNMLNQLFQPFATELRRFIRWAYDQPEPDQARDGGQPSSLDAEIPASDRVVTINHNAPEYEEVRTGLEGIEEQLRGSNKIGPDIKEQALAEMSASKALISARLVRLDAIKVVLIGMLRWVGKVFAETLLGKTIEALLAKVYALFPDIL